MCHVSYLSNSFCRVLNVSAFSLYKRPLIGNSFLPAWMRILFLSFSYSSRAKSLLTGSFSQSAIVTICIRKWASLKSSPAQLICFHDISIRASDVILFFLCFIDNSRMILKAEKIYDKLEPICVMKIHESTNLVNGAVYSKAN